MRAAGDSRHLTGFLVPSFLYSSHLGGGTPGGGLSSARVAGAGSAASGPGRRSAGRSLRLTRFARPARGRRGVGSICRLACGWWAAIFRPSPSSVLASSTLLALRAANIALARDFLTWPTTQRRQVPASSSLRRTEHVVPHPDEFPEWETRREVCETQLREMTQLMEERGSSANMVFRVRLLRSLLWRIQQVLSLQREDSESRKFAVTIVHGFATQRRIGTVLAPALAGWRAV